MKLQKRPICQVCPGRKGNRRPYGTEEVYRVTGFFPSLKPAIDAFFDTVMVMDENLDVRNNRLALLANIYKAMLKICDLSKIVYK